MADGDPSEERAAGARGGARRGLRIAVAVAAVLLALVAAALLFGREALRATLESQLAAALDARVAIGALEGPLYPEVVLRDVVIERPGEPFLALDSARARIDVLPLLLRGAPLRIEELGIDGLRLTLVRRADGTWRIPGAAGGEEEPSAGGGGSPDLEIGRVAVRGGRVTLRLEGEPGVELLARVELSASDLALPWDEPRRTSASLRVALAPSRVGPERLDEGALTAELSQGRLALRDTSVSGSFGAAVLEGGADVASLALGREASASLVAHFEGLALEPLTGRRELAGRLDGRLELAAQSLTFPGGDVGKVAGELRADLRLERSRLAFGELASARARGDVALRDGALERWSLDEGTLAGEGIAFDASGRGDARTIESLRVDARVADLARLAAWLAPEVEVSGAADLGLELAGPIARPTGDLAVTATSLRLGSRRLGDLRARATSAEGGRVLIRALALVGGEAPLRLVEPSALRLEDDAVVFEGLRLAGGGGSLSLRGGLTGSGFRALHVEASALDVGFLALLAASPVELAGTADANLELDGALPLPSVTGTLAWRNAAIDDVRVEMLRGEFATAAGRFDAGVDAQLGGGNELHATLSTPYAEGVPLGSALLASPDARLTLRGDELSLAWLRPILPETVRELSGVASIDLSLRGGDVPEARGSLSFRDAGFELPQLGAALGPIHGALRVAPDPRGVRVEDLELRMPAFGVPEQGDATLAGSGVIGPGGLHGVAVALRGLDVAPLSPGPGATPLGGVLELRFTADGPFGRPRIAGDALWSAPRVGAARLEAIALALDSTGDRITADLHLRESGREVLAATGKLPYPDGEDGLAAVLADPRLTVEVGGEGVDLALLEPFLPGRVRDVRGRATLEATVRAANGEPRVEGTLAIADGSVSVPLLRRTFAPIRGRLTLGSESFAVESLEVGEPGADARLEGRIAVDHLLPTAADLRLSLAHFPLSRSPLLRTDVDGKIALRGPLESLELSGDATLENAAAQLPDASDRDLKEIQVIARGDDGSSADGIVEGNGPPGLFDRAHGSFALRVPRNTWVRGRGAELEIEGEIEARKDALEPIRYVGSARVVRGTYAFQGKRFEVRRGVVTFDGGSQVDPLLDLEGAHRVRDVSILVFVTGRASEPVVRLASEPAMPESDVLSYLFLGRPANEAGASGGGLDQAATSLAAGVAASQAAALLERALPLDFVDIRIREGDDPGRIDVGKYVTENLFIRYGRTLGPDPVDDVRVELRLTDRWSVESQVTTNEDAGLNVFWTIDY